MNALLAFLFVSMGVCLTFGPHYIHEHNYAWGIPLCVGAILFGFLYESARLIHESKNRSNRKGPR